ncbi:hyalin-like [Patiria miniata]|uniref:Hyalin n=1 Tax=Patiria miniata TaxID=46514 RepID=A0A913Z929_PATMI|nr:hyalin-like [Patiria miniata]
MQGLNVFWTPPTATDASSYDTRSTHAPGELFPVAATQVTYTFTDVNGLSSTCVFTVTVTFGNGRPLVINCPANIIQEVSTGNRNGIEVTWNLPTVADDSGIQPTISLTSNAQLGPGSFFPFGSYTITYRATDVEGNSESCSFTVIVVDRVPPVLNCPPNIIREVTSGNGNGIEVSWNVPTATDNSGAEPTVSLSSNSQQGPGSFFQFGTYTIAYLATDETGNSMTCSFTVTVVDNEPPVISGCQNNIVLTTANMQGLNVFWTPPTATDASSYDTRSTHAPGELFPVAATQVTYTFTDVNGLSSTCVFTVTVTFGDGGPLVINCPANIIQEVSTGNRNGIEVTWNLPTVADDSGIQPTISLTSNAQLGPGSFFPFGSYTITYRATDVEGNSESCSFTVTVVDRVPPVLNCPPNIIQEVTSGNGNGIEVSWNVPTATDNSGAAPNVFLTSNSQQTPGSFFAFGTYTITYTASDGAGNSVSCSFTVNVVSPNPCLPSPCQNGGTCFNSSSGILIFCVCPEGFSGVRCEIYVDNEPPVISGCQNNIVLTTSNMQGLNVFWTPPTATDASSYDTRSTHAPGELFPVAATQVTYTFTDVNGLSSTCVFTVTVTFGDGGPLVINCPANIIQEVSTGNRNGIEVTWNLPTVADDSGIQPTISLTSNAQLGPGSFFPFGSYTITYRATDVEGNSESCSFTVTVVDRVPPVLNCPPNIIQEVTSGNGNGIEVSWNVPTATDNSGAAPNVFLTSNSQQTPGSFFAFGTYTITYTASDGAGNSVSCSFTVNVVSPNPCLPSPCQNGGTCFNSSSGILIFCVCPEGFSGVRCEIYVDNEPPVISGCQNNIVLTTANMQGLNVFWTPPTATDASSYDTRSTHAPGELFPVAATEVTYTFTDVNGLSSTCVFTVTVTFGDGGPLVINCPANIIQEVLTGNRNGIEVTWNLPTVADDSGIQPTISLTSNAQLGPGSFFPFGSYTITYRATDVEGNSESCSFTVTVVDRVPPVLNCPPNIIQEVTSGNGSGIEVSWNVPTATDNSGAAPNVFLTSNSQQTPGSFFAFGTYTITYTASDGAGNSVSCSFTVNVGKFLNSIVRNIGN